MRRTLATSHDPSPALFPSSTSGTEKSVRAQVRERGKGEDDVPNAASFFLPLHHACDGHSTVLCSPRVTAHLILFLCLLWPVIWSVWPISHRSPLQLPFMPVCLSDLFDILRCKCVQIGWMALKHLRVHSVRTDCLRQLDTKCYWRVFRFTLSCSAGVQKGSNKLKAKQKGQVESKRSKSNS